MCVVQIANKLTKSVLFLDKCDGRIHCADSTDELGCPCDENKGEFTCDCVVNQKCTHLDGCKTNSSVVDGYILCPNERVPLGPYGRIEIYRLNNVSECNNIGFPQCDNNTCFASNFSAYTGENCSSHVLCSSYCADKEQCNGIFQCADGSLILLSQFCDGIVDCSDGSDEIITQQPGFKCGKCILPQNNLYDNLAHCVDNLDFCFDDDDSCFECFDERLLISSTQVCDGVGDCFDLSDECLCEAYFSTSMCTNIFEEETAYCFDSVMLHAKHNSLYNNTKSKIITGGTKNPFIECYTKYNASIFATVSDGRPECKDYSDECQCQDPPAFCNDSCRSLIPMGDRYCDGVVDTAWQFINNTGCPQGFDELNCSKRFRCKANGKISIDVLQLCDGKSDCDDGLDEQNCPSASNRKTIFSSDTEMIANPIIKSAFWIIGLIVIFGNAYVIITTVVFLKKRSPIDSIGFQRVIILNIAIADFIMGIYLLTTAAFSEYFSGYYGDVDLEWRSSLSCSFIGSLAVISSELSCFLLVVLMAFRLKNISRAIESLTSSLRPWKVCIIFAWLLSLVLSFAPLLNATSRYFTHSFSYSSSFQNGTWNASNLEQFACRFAVLANSTMTNHGNEFHSAAKFVESNLLRDSSVHLFGYYGGTSVCLPRFYVGLGESSWEYTIAVITINFLSFLFIALGYVLMYKFSSKSSKTVRSSKSKEQTAKMQKRIARIIATDFCCWIPISILAYVRLGIVFSDIAYQISAVILLPINSALNPFLFSALPNKLISFFSQKYHSLFKSGWLDFVFQFLWNEIKI